MKRATILRTICVAFASIAMSAATAQVGSTLKSPGVVAVSNTTVARSTSKGAVVAVKGIASRLRLPAAAGKVTKVAPTGPLVPSAPTTTFLAHGNKSISLCYLNKAAKVTCTPVAHTAMLEGVEVSYFQKNGYNLIRFSPVPPIAKFSAIKTRIKAPVTFTARAFMVGLNKAAVVLEHHAARHTNDLPMPSVIEAGGCTYDDGGGLSCDGGGGGDGGESDPGGDMGCGDCSYPGDPDPDQPPDQDSVPATNANDPCTVVDGTTVCVMTGPRPMPAPIPTPPPVGSIPPVVGIPPIDQLPSGPAPWFPTVDWCSLLGLGCPANPPKGSYMDQPQYQEDIAACQKQYELDIIECNFYPNDSRMAIACRARAGDYNAACLTAAREAARAREP